MSASSPRAEVRSLLRAGQIAEAARRIASFADRAGGSDSWRLTLELCHAVAREVCDHKRIPRFRADATGAAILDVVRHVRSRGWSDPDALVTCAERAASRYAERQRRHRSRSSALAGPTVEPGEQNGFDAGELAGDFARLWQLALAQLDADHPIHAAQVRDCLGEGRLPDRHATASLRAALVLVCEREASDGAEDANVGFFAAVKVIAEGRGQGSTFFARFLK